MNTSAALAKVEPILDLLVRSSRRVDAQRGLVEIVLALDVARGVALWTRGSDRVADDTQPRWHCTLERGALEFLPRADLILAILEGEAPASALSQASLIVATPSARLALVLGGTPEDDERVDLAEALVHLFAILELEPLEGARHVPAPFSTAHEDSRGLEHDVRNALLGIRASNEVLERLGPELPRDEVIRLGQAVEGEWRRLGALVSRTTLPSEVESNEARSCAPAAVLLEVLGLEEASLHACGIKLRLKLDPRAAALRVALGEVDLARVVRNLLVNSRQALSHAPTPTSERCVWVDLETHGPSEILVRVSDNGPGFPAELTERLFDTGFTRGEHGGTGTGLATVRKLVHGGAGRVRAMARTEPTGATFEVILPSGIRTDS